MLGGATLSDVLPPEPEQQDEDLDDLNSLLSTNLLDPTAIVTEYRFVILVPRGPKQERDFERQSEQMFEQVPPSQEEAEILP